MLKKIALASALAVSASFATWDYYPVQEAGKGSVGGGLYYDWHDDWSQAGLKIGARYSVIQNLEISLQSFGYQFWSETDCDGCKNGGDGIRDLTVGARYQITPQVNAFLDLGLPIGGDDVSSDEIFLYLGAQFAMTQINGAPGLAFGTEAGIFWGFEHDNRERGLEVHLGGEVGYSIQNIGLTPLLGLQFKLRLTESTTEGANGDEYGDNDDGDSQIIIWLGAKYAAIPSQLDVEAKLFVRSGDHSNMGGDAAGIYLGCEFFF